MQVYFFSLACIVYINKGYFVLSRGYTQPKSNLYIKPKGQLLTDKRRNLENCFTYEAEIWQRVRFQLRILLKRTKASTLSKLFHGFTAPKSCPQQQSFSAHKFKFRKVLGTFHLDPTRVHDPNSEVKRNIVQASY